MSDRSSLRARLRAVELGAKTIKCPRCAGDLVTVEAVRLDGTKTEMLDGTATCPVCASEPRRIVLREVRGVPMRRREPPPTTVH